jgi:hypothetical protein
MNNEEPRTILTLYRPGTADRTDPSFHGALECAKPNPARTGRQDKFDPELGRWFKEHCLSYLSIRSKFLEIPAPPGLKDRILAECKIPAATIIPIQPMDLLRAAAILVVCLGLAAFFWRSHGREDDFNIYRSRMARTALQPYAMNLESHDLQSINAFFAGRKAPADYVLPDGVSKAQLVGCAVLQWQGQPVSMICFRSGQPLPPGQQTDLWLFVVDQSAVRNGPPVRPPLVAQVNKLMTAAWSQNGKTYILAAAGDEEFLRKYF